jgi:predicted alpha/beta hydrolase
MDSGRLVASHPATIRTVDEFDLAGQTYGDSASCRAGVLLVGAMGVDQQYYRAFAEWLATQGFFVATFDYRGMGDSRPMRYRTSLRGFDADVTTWATRDVPAAVDFVADRIGSKPLLWLGHSLGGQILGLVPNRDRVTAMVTIATGSGYWLQNAWRLRMLAWWLWFVIAPIATKMAGYFPGRRLRKVGDLPAGVMRQWRAWCLNSEYCIGVLGPSTREQYARVTTPILSLSFTDDEFMSRLNIESMHGFYAAAPREMRRIAPGDIGMRRIGHFGFFRRSYAESLWPQAAAWLGRFAH